MPFKALEYLATRPWMLREDVLQLGVDIVTREHEPQENWRERVRMVVEKAGRQRDDSKLASMRDGVCTIEMIGPIFRYANLLTETCGGTTLEQMCLDFCSAMDDPSCRAIMFHIDSPGGDATGIGEFANRIYQSRGTKPIVAYASGDVCSAAYYLGAACDSIMCAPMAMVGSIGVVMNTRKPDDPVKAKAVEFVSYISPNKRADPTTSEGRNQYQQMVDQMGDLFVADVAKFRGVSTEKVLSDFGQGGVKIGQAAIDSGMVDGLSSYEETLKELSGRASRSISYLSTAAAAHNSGEPSMGFNFLEWLKGQPPEAQAAVLGTQAQAQPNTQAQAQTPTPESPPVAARTREDENVLGPIAELAELQQQLADQKAATALANRQVAQAQAETFFSDQVHAGRMMPAEVEGAKALYLSLASQPQLLEGYKRTVTSRPSHGLFTESLQTGKAEEAVVLPSTRADRKDPNALPTKQRNEELLEMTSLGQRGIEVGVNAKYNGKMPHYPPAEL